MSAAPAKRKASKFRRSSAQSKNSEKNSTASLFKRTSKANETTLPSTDPIVIPLRLASSEATVEDCRKHGCSGDCGCVNCGVTIQMSASDLKAWDKSLQKSAWSDQELRRLPFFPPNESEHGHVISTASTRGENRPVS